MSEPMHPTNPYKSPDADVEDVNSTTGLGEALPGQVGPNRKGPWAHQILATAGLAVGAISVLPTTATILEPDVYGVMEAALVGAFAGLSGLFIIAGIALLNHRNWGRRLLCVLFYLPVLGLLFLIALYWKDFLPERDASALIGGTGMFLLAAVPFVTVIALLHSSTVKDEVNTARAASSHNRSFAAPEPPESHHDAAR